MTTRFADHLIKGTHAARPAATAVPEGTLYSCSTHNLIYQSDGATWATYATLGSTETLPATIIDAKGDLIGASAADTPARLAVGTNGQVLTADSAQSTGIKWATPAAGGVTLARPKAGATTYIGLPGVDLLGTVFSGASFFYSLNNDVYFFFTVGASISVAQIYCEVTNSVSANFRIGVYAADSDFQPTGAPLLDSGDISASTTGVKSYTPGSPVTLAAGNYLTAYNGASSSIGLRHWGAAAKFLAATLGATNYSVFAGSVGRTYAAFPSPGTAWTAGAVGTVALHPIFMRWTP